MDLDISPRLLAYLRSWFTTSTSRKTATGVDVTLTFQQFLSLIDKRQRRSLQRRIDTDSIRAFMADSNPFAYVLTWRSYEACSSRIFSVTTACVCSRMKSRKLNSPQKGDKLRPDHVQKISKGLTGKAKSQEHRDNISAGAKGSKKAAWTDERKAARSLLAQAREAAKRADKNGESEGSSFDKTN